MALLQLALQAVPVWQQILNHCQQSVWCQATGVLQHCQGLRTQVAAQQRQLEQQQQRLAEQQRQLQAQQRQLAEQAAELAALKAHLREQQLQV